MQLIATVFHSTILPYVAAAAPGYLRVRCRPSQIDNEALRFSTQRSKAHGAQGAHYSCHCQMVVEIGLSTPRWALAGVEWESLKAGDGPQRVGTGASGNGRTETRRTC